MEGKENKWFLFSARIRSSAAFSPFPEREISYNHTNPKGLGFCFGFPSLVRDVIGVQSLTLRE